MALMTRITGHHLLAVKITLVDIHDHLHHFARGILALVIVEREVHGVVVHVAKCAVHPEFSLDQIQRAVA